VAVYRQLDGSLWVDPVVAWALCDVTHVSRRRRRGTDDHFREYGDNELYRKVLAFVVDEYGDLEPAAESCNFLGCCRSSDDPAERLADAIAECGEPNPRRLYVKVHYEEPT